MDQNQNYPSNNNPYGNQNPYGGQNPYYRHPNNPIENGFVTASFILSILAFGGGVMGFSFFSFIPASLAIIFAILSKVKRDQLPNRSRAAVIIAISGCIIACVMTAYLIYQLITDPAMMEQFNAIMKQMYGMTYEEMMDQLQNGTIQY